MTTYTVVNARGRTVLPASDAATAALYRRVFDDKHGQGSHRVVPAGPGGHISARAPPLLAAPLFIAASILLIVMGTSPVAAGTTERASVGPGGVQSNGDSNGGHFSLTLLSDGRYVGFDSSATNLVPGDTNGATDVFVRDRLNRTTTRASIATDGTQAVGLGGSRFPIISADGQYVAFSSIAANLVPGDTNGTMDVFVRTR